MIKKVICIVGITLFLLAGCAKRALVAYEDVEKTNSVVVSVGSGKKITGTIINTEPHQITVLQKDNSRKVIAKSSIRSIKRKPPVTDDYGNGISDNEIASVQGGKNATVYGIGGGALSFGASFFFGSLVGKESGTTLAVTTAVGGTLGTLLFIHAGKSKDRQAAIETIREKRRMAEIKKETDSEQQKLDDLNKLLEEEKAKQEKLRTQREQLLRQLDDQNMDKQ